MDRAIKSLASFADQAAHFSKKQCEKEPEVKESLVN